jgi:RNA polymerase sigma factor (sigma-70 family)
VVGDDGSVAADFEQLYPELFRRAAGLVYRMLGDRTVAEDVAAETLARAYVRWKRVGSLPYRDAWVLRVATNLAIDVARRRPPSTAGQVYSEDVTDVVLLRAALVAALQSLSRRQREAVVLRYLTGLPEPDVAAALGISVGAAHSHIHRGLASLRGQLGPSFREVFG